MEPTKIEGTVVLSDDKGVPYGRLEISSGRVLSLTGKYTGQTLSTHGPRGVDDFPEGGDTLLSEVAARYAYKHIAKANNQPHALMRDAGGEEVQVNMDLAITDVHIPSAIPTYAAGYALADGIADTVSPVITTSKSQDYFFTWDSANAFKRVIPNASAPGAQPPEVNPTLSNTKFTTVPYALGAFIDVETEANADAPLRPYEAAVFRVMDALRLEREFRVVNLLTTSGNWNSNNVIAVAGGAQWNEGSSSNPILNLHKIEQQSFMPLSRWIFSRPAYQAFVRNPAVRAFWAMNQDMGANIPTPDQISSLLKIAPITIADMKYSSAGAAQYVWPSLLGAASSVVALRQPKQNPPTSQRDVATNYTFRWTAAPAPDGTITAGWMVRSYFDPKRGGRGGRVAVVAHNDIEVMTSNIVGGLLTGVLQ